MSKNQLIGLTLLASAVLGICLTVRYCDPPTNVDANDGSSSISAESYRKADEVLAKVQADREAAARKVKFSMTGVEVMKGALGRSRMDRCNETFRQYPNFKMFFRSSEAADTFNQKIFVLNDQLKNIENLEFSSEDELRAYYLHYMNDLESADRWLDANVYTNVDYNCRYTN